MFNEWLRACSAFVVGIALAGSCFAATIVVPIPTNSGDFQYTPGGYSSPVTVTGHGATGTQTVPGWTWNYTGNFSDSRYAMYMSSSNSSYACLGPQAGISLPWDCDSDNNLAVPAGDDYPGYEFHFFTFALPAGAQSIRMNFYTIGSDDRAVVTLNGQPLGNFGSPATDQPHLGPSGTVLQTFALPPGGNTWYDDPALFQTGTNVLRLWVNNTGSGGSGTAKTHAGGGGSSGSVVRGFVTYEYAPPPAPAAPVPTLAEWARVLLAMLVMAAAAWYWRRRGA